MSKKSFKDNPALQFMSRTEEVINEPKEGSSQNRDMEVREIKQVREISDNFRMVPIAFEAKSKRFNMLIRPSVFANLRKMSENRGTSVNDLINTIVENYIENNSK